MPEDRRLAAIMFTDIVGYTALMGSDEDKAFKVLRKNREIQRPIIKKYRGEWLKEMGDGILASFHTASDAVRCAGKIQQAAKKEGIGLRIGIHTGEVVFEGHDVLGDGVNVASRLEELAKEGCINISGAVYKDIRNKAGITAEFIEEKTLKNVEEPVKVYSVMCDEPEVKTKTNGQNRIKNKTIYYFLAGVLLIIVAFLIWFLRPQKKLIELEKSIAVLPFEYMSEDQNKQYLADGVMDAITGHLSKIEGLRVTPRTSVEQYRGTNKTASVIGEELDVSYLIEGSFLLISNEVRLTIQLVNAKKEDHLLFKEYDRDYKDIFKVQSEVAQTIAKEVEVTISPAIKERIETIPTKNLEAYELYLKGNSYNDFTVEGTYEAMEFYNKAIGLDENLVDAYVQLAQCNWYLAHFSGTPPAPFWIASRNYSKTAIRLDSNNAEAYGELGVVLHNWDWDSTATRKAYEKALYLEPNNYSVWNHYFHFNMVLKKFLIAESFLDKLVSLEPNNKRPIDYLIIYLRQGKYQKASQTLNKINLTEVNNWVELMTIGIYYLSIGELQNAVIYFERSLDGADIESLPHLAYTYAKLGERDKTISILDQLNEAAKIRYISLFHFAIVYAGLEDFEECLKFLKKAHEEKDYRLHLIGSVFNESIFEPLQSNPEYQEIISNLWN